MPWREKLAYRFENFMAKGGASIFLSLVVLFAVSFSLGMIVRWIVLAAFPGIDIFAALPDHMWNVFLSMTDPGNMGVDTDNSAWAKVSTVLTGVLGVVIFSMLIAFITTALDSMMHEFRKGRSRVMEEGQTLILGWSERVLDILRELIIANESERKASAVILAERDKEAMDDDVSTFLPDTKTTKVVTRTGSTSSIANLKRVHAQAAKSAIVLAACSDHALEDERRASDAKVVKTILALTATQGGKNDIPIVAELFFQESRDLVATFEDSNITCVDSWDILGKILVQTSRTSGLAVVYNEMLSFDGCEMYLYGADWGGVRFYDALYHFADGVVLGIVRADGAIEIRPDKDAVLQPGDEVLILAEDNSTVAFAPAPVAAPRELLFATRRLEKSPERELFLGWHHIAEIVVREYADYLVKGSLIDIALHQPSQEVLERVAALRRAHPDLRLQVLDRDPMELTALRSLEPFGYDNVIILSQSEQTSPDRVDSETLVVLLLLRKILRDSGVQQRKTKLITQILESESQDLIYQTNVDDFIISNRLITMIFAQLSEQPRMKAIYDDMFAEEGSEIYLKPAELYFPKLPVEAAFADLMGQAQKRDEICLGYRLGGLSLDTERNFGVKLNPAKDAMITLGPGDSLVVLAEDEL